MSTVVRDNSQAKHNFPGQILVSSSAEKTNRLPHQPTCSSAKVIHHVFLTQPARLHGVLHCQNPHCSFPLPSAMPYANSAQSRNSSAPAAQTASPFCNCKTLPTRSRNAPRLSSTPSSPSATLPPPGSPNGSASARTYLACTPSKLSARCRTRY